MLRSVWAEVDEDGEAGVGVLTHDEASVCLLGSALYHITKQYLNFKYQKFY